MVRAWVFDGKDDDQRLPHQTSPIQELTLKHLDTLGILYWKLKTEDPLNDSELAGIRARRSYKNHDLLTISRDKLPDYDNKLKIFFQEHLHEDEEIRFCLEGGGYFDVRNSWDPKESWIRIEVSAGDMLVLPAGIYHRFTLDSNNFMRVMRLFQDEPKWIPYNRREPNTEKLGSRGVYRNLLGSLTDKAKQDAPPPATATSLALSAATAPTATATATATPAEAKDSSNGTATVNGTAVVMADGSAASALAHYPHARRAGGFIFVSGASSRRSDNTHRGATKNADGSWKLDIGEQTAGCFDNIRAVLKAAGADLSHLVDVTCFLTDMSHYDGMNKVYNTYFTAANGPTRTTVAVKQLPHPNLVIEIKAVALAP
jgi:1,2-dihydroxy-3-keto-5-methylthiopentene dioxygenase